MGRFNTKSLSISLLVLCFFALPHTALADCTGQQCIESGQWRFGLALGVGAKSNPLVDGDAIPLLVLPDIAYYGDNLYLDNTELGYQWLQSDTSAVDTFVSINSEKAFFTFWHPSNLLLPANNAFNQAVGPSNESPYDTRRVSIDDVQSRKWAIDAGIRWHIRSGNSQWRFTAKTDATGVHHGHQFEVGYRYHWKWQEWQVSIAPGITWKSSQLIDYYYGIHPQDNLDSTFYYQGASGWQSTMAIGASKAINQDWQWLARASYTWFNSGMTNSPLVDQSFTRAVFIGVGYVFE